MQIAHENLQMACFLASFGRFSCSLFVHLAYLSYFHTRLTLQAHLPYHATFPHHRTHLTTTLAPPISFCLYVVVSRPLRITYSKPSPLVDSGTPLAFVRPWGFEVRRREVTARQMIMLFPAPATITLASPSSPYCLANALLNKTIRKRNLQMKGRLAGIYRGLLMGWEGGWVYRCRMGLVLGG